MSKEPTDSSEPDETTFGLPVPKEPPGSSDLREMFDDDDADGQRPTIEVISGGDVVRRDLDRDVRSIRGLEIRDRIGRGSFGVVYQAWDPDLGVERAVKILRRDLLEEDERRFAREGRLLAALDHPSIARVHQTGVTAGGRPYIVMDFIRGLPITQFADEHKLNLDDRVKLMIAVCGAVQHAHARGIIHRDLKPENILVERHADGAVPKVIDFGIAKVVAAPTVSSQEPTRLGMVLGTYPYMSPEQADPSILDVDVTADVHALGVVLYELLTGLLPRDLSLLEGRSELANLRSAYRTPPVNPTRRLSDEALRDADTVFARITSPRRTDLSGLLRGLRGDLETIAMHCIDSDRSERYPTADALATDLKRFLEGMPLLRGPRTPLYHAKKFVRRHRAGVAMVTLVSLVIVALGITSTVFAVRENAARTDAESAAADALAATEVAERQRERATQLAGLLRVLSSIPGAVLDSVDQSYAGDALIARLVEAAPVEGGRRDDVERALSGVASTELMRQFLLDTILRPSAARVERAIVADAVEGEAYPREAAEVLRILADRFIALGDSTEALRLALEARRLVAEDAESARDDRIATEAVVVAASARSSESLAQGDAGDSVRGIARDAFDRLSELDPENESAATIRAGIHFGHLLTKLGQPLPGPAGLLDPAELVEQSAERFGRNARETGAALALQAAQEFLSYRAATDPSAQRAHLDRAIDLGREAHARLAESGAALRADRILAGGNLVTYLARTGSVERIEEAIVLAEHELREARFEFGDYHERTMELVGHRAYAYYFLGVALLAAGDETGASESFRASANGYGSQWEARRAARGPNDRLTLLSGANWLDVLAESAGDPVAAAAEVARFESLLRESAAGPVPSDAANEVGLLFRSRGKIRYLLAIDTADADQRVRLLQGSLADLERAQELRSLDGRPDAEAEEWLGFVRRALDEPGSDPRDEPAAAD